jgi:hypothetical protein
LRRDHGATQRNEKEIVMTEITGFGLPPITKRPGTQASDASLAFAQGLNSFAADGGAAAQAATGTNAPTGSAASPRLSADVVGSLISNQQASTEKAPSTNLAGSPVAPNAGGSKNAPSSDPSKPQTLQQIASQYDIHHLTDQQEAQFEGQLVTSGALSQKDGLRLFATTVLADAFNAQHYRIVNGQLVATTPSPPGTLIGAGGPPGGPQYDIVQRVQQSLAADQYFGDTQNAAKDQNILNVLNKLDAIRNGSAT